MYNNYKVIKQEELKDIASRGTLLKHEKSGARVVILENDDENKMFLIGFKTPPHDDTGVPHIIEHSVLCGSRKYPVKEPFVELMKGSLNTFLNAMTFSDKTVYPVASCNDKDFQNLMDVYMDAVLYPNILTNEKIFKQEGWHYELKDKDDDLIYNGVVYNEMKGAFSSEDQILARESLNSLFPDNAYGVESGGNPDSIPDLTYENFVNFYKKYYHPSNSYIVIYGNCNMEEKLEYLDQEYLSKFDKIDLDSNILPHEPFTETKVKELFYQLPEGQDSDKKTLMSYNFAMPKDMDEIDKVGLDILTTVLLNSNGAPLKEALLKSGCANVIDGYLDTELLQPVFTIMAKGSNKENQETFTKTILDTLHDLVMKGIDKKAIEASLNILEFKLREADYGGMSKGLIYALTLFNTWLYDEYNPFEGFDYTKCFNKLREYINTHYYEYLILKYLLKNTHRSLVLVEPSKTCQTEHDNLIKEKLLKYKESLSDEELQRIIDETKELKEYQAAADTQEALDTIPTLSREDISKEVKESSNVCSLFGDTNVVHHNYNTSSIIYLDLNFDLKGLTQEELVFAGILSDLFGKLNTEKRSYLDLDQEINIHTGGIRTSVSSLLDQDKKAKGFFSISVTALANKLDYAMELVKEIIGSSDYSMKDKIKEILTQKSQMMTQRFVGAGHQTAAQRALSYFDDASVITQEANGISYYDNLMECLNNYDEVFDLLKDKLHEIEKRIFNKNNLIISATCNDEDFVNSKEIINNFILSLDYDEVEERLVLEKEVKNEGFKAPFNVNYCALAGNFEASGLKYNGTLDVTNNLISTDYLWKNVRVLGGAYGCMLNIGRNGNIVFTSYRDPKIKETYDAYKNIINYLDNLEFSEEELFKFVIGAIGNLEFPRSPRAQGAVDFREFMEGVTKEDKELRKEQLLNTTLEDVKNSKQYFEAIFENGVLCTIGNSEKVEENKELFKTTLNLLK